MRHLLAPAGPPVLAHRPNAGHMAGVTGGPTPESELPPPQPDLLAAQVARRPHRLAMMRPASTSASAREWTYAQLWADAQAIARGLLALKRAARADEGRDGGTDDPGAPLAEPGHIVAMLLPHCEAYVLALFGIWLSGGAVFPLEVGRARLTE